jgi:hypothetical protein
MLWLIIGYMYMYIHRPFEVWPSLGDLRIELIYMILMCGYWLAAARKQWTSNPLHKAFFAFFFAALLCWALSPWPDHGALAMDRYYKLLVFYLILVTSVRDEEDLRRVLIAYLAVMTFYMMHSLWSFRGGRHHFRMGIVRLVGVDTSHGDPNAFGACVLNSLVFVVPLWHSVRQQWERVALASYAMLGVLCIGLTGSRTSFAGLVLLIALVCAASKRRWSMAFLAVVLAPVAFMALPPSLQTRFETIINPAAGPANAQTSAEDRIEGLRVGAELLQRFPLSGCGPGAWIPASRRLLEAHSLYGQVMGEMGVLGIATFAFVLLAYWYNVRRIARVYREHPEWKLDFLAYVGQASGFVLILLLFEGIAGHNLFRFSWLWFGAFLTIARHCVEARAVGLAPVRQTVIRQAPAFPPNAWGSYAR